MASLRVTGIVHTAPIGRSATVSRPTDICWATTLPPRPPDARLERPVSACGRRVASAAWRSRLVRAVLPACAFAIPSEDAPKPARESRTYISIELSAQFGLALRDARLRAGLTQTEVAKQARVSQTYVSRLELGSQKLTVERISLLAGIVGLNMSVLLVDD